MTNQVRYKVSVRVEEANGLNIGQYLGVTCEVLVEAVYSGSMYDGNGKVGLTVKDIRLKDKLGRAVPTPAVVLSFLHAHESVVYNNDTISIEGAEDGVKGQIVIKLSADRGTVTGLGVFSAGFWQCRLMAGLNLRIEGEAL